MRDELITVKPFEFIDYIAMEGSQGFANTAHLR